MSYRPNIATINISRTQRDGRLMQLHSSRKELELAHVPRSQQRAGPCLKAKAKAGGPSQKGKAGAAASGPQHLRARPRDTTPTQE
jgi:hypothetical protein